MPNLDYWETEARQLLGMLKSLTTVKDQREKVTTLLGKILGDKSSVVPEALRAEAKAVFEQVKASIDLDSETATAEYIRTRELSQDWQEVCERIYKLFPTATKLKADPASLLGFMIGLQLRLEKTEKR